MIYLLEDDGSIRDFVIYTLNSQGLPARGFPLPSEFWKAVEEEVPELVLLDIMLPEEDGLTVLKKLRQDGRTAAVPVIMLTAKGTEYDKVVGLDSGADDYVAKPFGMLELLSRIRVQLRRTHRDTQEVRYRCGVLEVDPAAGYNPEIKDITSNPLNLEFIEVEAANTASLLPDVTAAFINGAHAVDNGLNVEDAVYTEQVQAGSDNPYINILACRTEDLENEVYQKVLAAYQSDETAKAIEEIFQGTYIPAWE